MKSQMDRAVSCAFTGHRPEALPWGENEDDPRCAALKKRLDEELRKAYQAGFRHFICGMARGSDLYFCEAVIRLRQRHGDITLEAAVPFAEQSQRWSAADRERHSRLLEQCDLETLIQREHTPTCMRRRNRYMVDHASLLIAVFNGDPKGSGTLGTLHYALKEGLRVEILEV